MNEKIDPTDARQGEKPNRMRWVLTMSVILTMIALSIVLYDAP